VAKLYLDILFVKSVELIMENLMVKLVLGPEKASNELDITVKKHMLKHLYRLYKSGSVNEVTAKLYKCKLCGRIKTHIDDGYQSPPELCYCDGDYGNDSYGLYEEVGSRTEWQVPSRVRELFNEFWDKLWIDEEGNVRGKYV
jgi:hypothetical protein